MKLVTRAIFFLLLVLGACNSILGNDEYKLVSPSDSCRLDSDCAPGNVCIFATCGPECAGDGDCAKGFRCLVTDKGTACVSSTIATCAAGCPSGSTCSGTVCRNTCDTAQCLAGQTCTTDNVCVGTTEHEASGGVDTSAGGHSGATGIGGASSIAGSSGIAGRGGSGGNAEIGGSAGEAAGGEAGATGGTGPIILKCGNSSPGDSVACNELPDGTAIAFPGGTAQGTCKAGTKICGNDGKFAQCLGAVAPAQTDCSSTADNNCDGKADNTECGACVKDTTQVCYDGPAATKDVTPCKHGTQTCVLDASQKATVWGPCTGEVVPADHDTCDSGNDATCNGKPNEGCTCLNGSMTTCGAAVGARGACASGSTTCTSGAWGACSIAAQASDTCDLGNDANCDGTPNEGCACINGTMPSCGAVGAGCTAGSAVCSNGTPGTCNGNTCTDAPSTVVGNNGVSCSCPGEVGTGKACPCSIPVCATGFHETSMAAKSSTAGSCTIMGVDPANTTNVLVTENKPSSIALGNCLITNVMCRHDGF